MVSRLSTLYKLFKYNFFSKINCDVILLNDFIDMTFKNQVNYIEIVFNKINRVLTNNIMYFKLYESYRKQLENLLIPTSIDINVMEVSSDMDNDDIDFILC